MVMMSLPGSEYCPEAWRVVLLTVEQENVDFGPSPGIKGDVREMAMLNDTLPSPIGVWAPDNLALVPLLIAVRDVQNSVSETASSAHVLGIDRLEVFEQGFDIRRPSPFNPHSFKVSYYLD